MGVKVNDYSDQAKAEIKSRLNVGLEMIGLVAEGYAKDKCPVDTGALRNSITHTVQGNTAYIGTNVEYGKYVELGTGSYAVGGGRQTPWKGPKGVTRGQKPQPFLKPAATNHGKEYIKILEDVLSR